MLNALAGHRRFGGPLIVVDFGTATTFDVVDKNGDYLGGVICPGINLSIEALHQAAAQLPRIGIARPQAVIGRSTVPAMQSGIYWGYVGMIEGLVTRIKAEFGGPMKVIATGGLAPLFSEGTLMIEQIEPDLTLEGLRLLAERNPAPTLPRERTRLLDHGIASRPLMWHSAAPESKGVTPCHQPGGSCATQSSTMRRARPSKVVQACATSACRGGSLYRSRKWMRAFICQAVGNELRAKHAAGRPYSTLNARGEVVFVHPDGTVRVGRSADSALDL